MTFGLTAAEIALVAVAAAGAGVSAYSASEQAEAQKKANKYQADVAANNAKITEYQRSAALQQGEIDAQNAMVQQSQLIGRQRAALASNGVDLNEGSALDLLASSNFLGAQDVNAIQNNAAKRAWGYQVEDGNYRAQSNLSKWKADSTDPVKTGVMTGASSLLSSASIYAGSKVK